MMENQLIENTKRFVKHVLKDAEGGHDWFHTERVYKNAIKIAKGEAVDMRIVALAALLHDIADSKFHNGDETIGPRMAREFLFQQNVDSAVIEHVVQIIKHMSFKNSLENKETFESMELFVVRDADRLDAMGAIGIARSFNYGGFKNRMLYDPSVKPNLQMNKADYKSSTAPTINHFYEKLLLLKDRMHTKTAKKMAKERHDYMESFLKQFYAEWDGMA